MPVLGKTLQLLPSDSAKICMHGFESECISMYLYGLT